MNVNVAPSPGRLLIPELAHDPRPVIAIAIYTNSFTPSLGFKINKYLHYTMNHLFIEKWKDAHKFALRDFSHLICCLFYSTDADLGRDRNRTHNVPNYSSLHFVK